MAENEVKLKVTTETDIAPLEEMDDVIDDIQDKSDVKVSVDDGDIEDATDKTEELTDGLEEADDTTVSPDTDTSGFDELIDVAEEIRDKLDEISNTTVAPEVDTSGLEKAKEDVEETESSIGSLKTAIVGLVATAEIEHMATVADNVNNSWNRLKLTFEGTNVTMDVLKERVTEVSSETSRGAGIIREYFNQMGIAGVTNVDLLASSFESLSGKAYQTNSSIEEMESKMQTMVLTGNASSKMLKALGLSAEDLARSIGVSVDELSEAFSQLSPEQRLQAITNAMGDGATANAMYGDSYEAMKTKAENAMSGLEGAVGQAILPSVIPALDAGTQAVKGLTQGFKNLPEPVQGAIGTVLGVGAIATTGIGMFGEFAGAIANLGDAYGVLKDVYKALIPVEYAEGTAGWFSIGWIAAAILLGIALGLAFIYLYENCEWFREGVNDVVEGLQWLVDLISGSVMGVFEDFTNAFGLSTDSWQESILAFIAFIPMLPLAIGTAIDEAVGHLLGFDGSLTGYLGQAATNAYQAFSDGIDGLRERLQEELDGMIQDATDFSNGLPPIFNATGVGMVSNWIFGTGESSPGYMYDAFHGELLAMLTYAATFLVTLPSRLGSAARNTVSNFASSIRGLAGHLSAELSSMISDALNFAGQIGSILWNAGVNAITGFLSGLDRHSPGIMQREFVAEITEMGERVPEESRPLIRNVTSLGENLVDSFNGDLGGIEFGNARVVGSNSNGKPGSVVNLTLNVGSVDKQERVDEIIEAVRNYFYWDNTTAGRTN